MPNDLHQILDAAQIQHIYTNGGTTKRLYEKFQKDLAVPMTGLPSKSCKCSVYDGSAAGEMESDKSILPLQKALEIPK